MNWDVTWFFDINHLAARASWADSAMAAFALWGGATALVAIVAVTWWWGRRRVDAVAHSTAAILTGIAALLALVANKIAALFYYHPRPFVALHGVTVLLHHSADNSFPSDHAAIAGAMAIGLLLYAPRWGVLGAVLALLLCFARVYTGMHYPLDVMVGLVLGVGTGLLVVWGAGRPAAHWLDRHTPRQARWVLTAPTPAATEHQSA